MARATNHDTARADVYERDGQTTFLVTMRAVVGEITIDPYGDGPPPHVAAFEMIARNDTPGCYEFPMADGRTCRVDVDYDGGPQ